MYLVQSVVLINTTATIRQPPRKGRPTIRSSTTKLREFNGRCGLQVPFHDLYSPCSRTQARYQKKIIGIDLSGNQKTNSSHALSITGTPSSCLGFRMTIPIRPPS